jgi:O-antigen ligase
VAAFALVLILAIGALPVRNILDISSIRDKLMFEDRLQIGYLYEELIKDFPVAGTGFGMQIFFDESLLAKYNLKLPPGRRLPEVFNKPPHNLLIDTTVRLGLVGLMLFLFIIGTFLKMGLKNARKGKDVFIRDWGGCVVAAFAAVFIQGFFENTMSGPPAIVLYTILGMMAILWRLDRQTPEPA